MSSARKRMSLFKAHNEIDRLRQQVMMLQHRCACMPGQSLTINQQLHAALINVICDLEMRSNMKLGDQRGVVDIGNGAYLQAKEALSVVKSKQAEAARLTEWQPIESTPPNEIRRLKAEITQIRKAIENEHRQGELSAQSQAILICARIEDEQEGASGEIWARTIRTEIERMLD